MGFQRCRGNGRKEGVSQLTYAFTLHVKLLDEIKEQFLFII